MSALSRSGNTLTRFIEVLNPPLEGSRFLLNPMNIPSQRSLLKSRDCPWSVRWILVVYLLCGLYSLRSEQPKEVADASGSALPSATLHVVPLPTDRAEQILLASLQGLVNRHKASLWVAAGGMHAIILDELRQEKLSIRDLPDVWSALDVLCPENSTAILCDLNSPSLNVATSIAGLRDALITSPSLTNRLAEIGVRVSLDVRQWTEAQCFNEFHSQFARGQAVHQSPNKTPHLRDWAVANRLFTFYEPTSVKRSEWISQLGPNPLVYGWGADEHDYVRDVSRGGGVVIPSDWCLNLSAYPHLLPQPATLPSERSGASGNPLTPHNFSRKAIHTSSPALAEPLRPQERLVAFVVSDGDNIQWLMGQFARHPGFWASPVRGQIPVTWEIAPILGEIAPRVLDWLQRTATVQDDFIAGPSGHGYYFPHHAPNRAALARTTGVQMAQAGLGLVSLLNSGGDFQELVPLMSEISVQGVLYKDYAPYHKRKGQRSWINGKPCLAYRHLLWDNMEGADPDSVAAALNSLPPDPELNNAAVALVNVHAWSFKNVGGPLGAIQRTVNQLNPDVQVVTATTLFNRLNRHAPSPVSDSTQSAP